MPKAGRLPKPINPPPLTDAEELLLEYLCRCHLSQAPFNPLTFRQRTAIRNDIIKRALRNLVSKEMVVFQGDQPVPIYQPNGQPVERPLITINGKVRYIRLPTRPAGHYYPWRW